MVTKIVSEKPDVYVLRASAIVDKCHQELRRTFAKHEVLNKDHARGTVVAELLTNVFGVPYEYKE